MDKIAITLDGQQRVYNLAYERSAQVTLICDNGDGTADTETFYDYGDTEADAVTALPSEPVHAVLNALAADLEDAALAARDGKGDYLATMEDVAQALAALAVKVEV